MAVKDATQNKTIFLTLTFIGKLVWTRTSDKKNRKSEHERDSLRAS